MASSDFVIESGIPISGIFLKRRYPFGDMEIGDSFFIPKQLLERVASAMSYYGSRHGKKFVRRIDGDGYRIWRTA